MATKKINTDPKVVVENKLTALKELDKKGVVAKAKKFSNQYKVVGDKKFKLKDFATNVDNELGKAGKPIAQQLLQFGVQTLAGMQDKLYAQDRWSLYISRSWPVY